VHLRLAGRRSLRCTFSSLRQRRNDHSHTSPPGLSFRSRSARTGSVLDAPMKSDRRYLGGRWSAENCPLGKSTRAGSFSRIRASFPRHYRRHGPQGSDRSLTGPQDSGKSLGRTKTASRCDNASRESTQLCRIGDIRWTMRIGGGAERGRVGQHTVQRRENGEWVHSLSTADRPIPSGDSEATRGTSGAVEVARTTRHRRTRTCQQGCTWRA
jgi:hypothetical protein